MKIAIIGVGRVGGTPARAWAAKGHGVVLGVPSPHNAEVHAVVTTTGGQVRALSIGDVVAGARVVLPATPGRRPGLPPRRREICRSPWLLCMEAARTLPAPCCGSRRTIAWPAGMEIDGNEMVCGAS